jgi:hypothetical protein
MNSSRRGKRRRAPSAAAGSASQQAEMNQDAGSSDEMQPGPDEPIQPQLVAVIKEQVLQALASDRASGTKRRKHRRKESSSRKKKSSKGRDSESSAQSSSNSDSHSDSGTTSSSESDSESDDTELLSSPTTSQIDLKLKHKIWQNKYVDFVKLLPKDDLESDKSLHLQNAGNSEYKVVASKHKKTIKILSNGLLHF